MKYVYVVLCRIVTGSKTSLAQKFLPLIATTMALSSFGPYHGLWHKDAQTRHIDITLTLGMMMHALGFNVLTPQPEIFHTYGTVILHDFFCVHDIKSIVNNNMILDQVINSLPAMVIHEGPLFN
jgi:hypothetical protein